VVAALVAFPAIADSAQPTAKHNSFPPVPRVFAELQKADGSIIYHGPIVPQSLSFGVSGFGSTSAVCERVRFRLRALPFGLQTHRLYAAFVERAPLKVAALTGPLSIADGETREITGHWTLELEQAVISAIHTSLASEGTVEGFTDDITLTPRAMTLTFIPNRAGGRVTRTTVTCH
jgi:hypothetical protein